MPVQSDTIPLINVYFTLCMGFSLSAMIWFSVMNLLREHKKVPKFFRFIVLNYICYIMCVKTFKIKKRAKSCCCTNTNDTPVKGRRYLLDFEKKQKFFLSKLIFFFIKWRKRLTRLKQAKNLILYH